MEITSQVHHDYVSLLVMNDVQSDKMECFVI